jgi:hypothetical protein
MSQSIPTLIFTLNIQDNDIVVKFILYSILFLIDNVNLNTTSFNLSDDNTIQNKLNNKIINIILTHLT